MTPDLLTTSQAAIRCRYRTPRMIQRAIATGELAATRYGRDYLIAPADVDAWKLKRRPAHRPKKSDIAT